MTTEQEYRQEQEYQQKLASMIKGIARRSAPKLFSRDVEDIEQDLWVKVLEAEKRKGGQLDLNLAAKICYDYVKDMIDYDQRRNHDTIDTTSDEFVNHATENPSEGTIDKGTYDSDILIRDLYNKFPEGSKERIFLDFYGNMTGDNPNDRAVPASTRSNDGYSENALAQMLGYASSASGGYRKFKEKMKNYIADYLALTR